MDLDMLTRDVLYKGPSAALPCNLPDYWLKTTAQSLEQVLGTSTGESAQYLAGPLALITLLLFTNSGTDELKISQSRLYECLQMYYMEVSLELLSRESHFQIEPANLETIFTDRKIISSMIP